VACDYDWIVDPPCMLNVYNTLEEPPDNGASAISAYGDHAVDFFSREAMMEPDSDSCIAAILHLIF
jgi:hypothetical protein